jgi:hypothetical protein
MTIDADLLATRAVRATDGDESVEVDVTAAHEPAVAAVLQRYRRVVARLDRIRVAEGLAPGDEVWFRILDRLD